MGEKLFRPLEDLLPDDGPLVLIPLPPMLVLPLQLATLTGGKSLLDRFEVTYCSQVCFGDEEPKRAETSGPGEVFIASYSPETARLPFAALEERAVAERYATGPYVVSGENATPEAVLLGLERGQLAHLCCHGNFDWESPLDSMLLFAGRGLSVREIQLSLARSPCDLIVLSACEAGTSQIEGSDFASILLEAGCGIVIAADWRIDDLSTTVLMEKLHWALAKGAGAAEALAVAQRSMQTEPAGEMAARVRNWLSACAAELTPEEQAYVTKKLDALAERAQEAVFADPVYWGSFSVKAERFRLARSERTIATNSQPREIRQEVPRGQMKTESGSATCPSCGSQLPTEELRQWKELGVDGVRAACPKCGTVLFLDFKTNTVKVET